jgi:uncharacterized membrane protein
MTGDLRTEIEADSPEGRETKLLGAERLVFFSDAVVAIALTLLALELPVPAGGPGDSDTKVLSELLASRDEYIAFLISFAVIGVQWFGHHRSFANVVGLAGRLPSWNMLWLLTIVLTPFATKVLTADGGFRTRFILYASNQALSGVFFLLMIHTINRYGLRGPGTPPQAITAGYVRLISMTSAFLISIPVAFVTQWAYLCWVAIPALIKLVNAVLRRRAAARAG